MKVCWTFGHLQVKWLKLFYIAFQNPIDLLLQQDCSKTCNSGNLIWSHSGCVYRRCHLENCVVLRYKTNAPCRTSALCRGRKIFGKNCWWQDTPGQIAQVEILHLRDNVLWPKVHWGLPELETILAPSPEGCCKDHTAWHCCAWVENESCAVGPVLEGKYWQLAWNQSFKLYLSDCMWELNLVKAPIFKMPGLSDQQSWSMSCNFDGMCTAVKGRVSSETLPTVADCCR